MEKKELIQKLDELSNRIEGLARNLGNLHDESTDIMRDLEYLPHEVDEIDDDFDDEEDDDEGIEDEKDEVEPEPEKGE